MESFPSSIRFSISSVPLRQLFSPNIGIQFTLGISPCFERIHFVGAEGMRDFVVDVIFL